MIIQWKTRTKHCTGHDYPMENTDKTLYRTCLSNGKHGQKCTGHDYPMKNTDKTLQYYKD